MGHKSFDFVTKNNLVVLFDNSDPDGIHWNERYANKIIEINKVYNGKLYSFNATIGNNTLEGEVTVYVKSSILSLQYNNEYNM